MRSIIWYLCLLWTQRSIQINFKHVWKRLVLPSCSQFSHTIPDFLIIFLRPVRAFLGLASRFMPIIISWRSICWRFLFWQITCFWNRHCTFLFTKWPAICFIWTIATQLVCSIEIRRVKVINFVDHVLATYFKPLFMFGDIFFEFWLRSHL